MVKRFNLRANGMEFNNLRRQFFSNQINIGNAIDDVLNSQKYIDGPQVGELEAMLAEYVGVNYAIGCASGTDALTLALMANNIGSNDAVFTTAFSFVAAAEAICLLKAEPVFVDIDPKTYNIDPEDLIRKIEYYISNYPLIRPKAIIAVNLFGEPSDYDRINQIAENNNLTVIEDMAQSFGASYKGARSGNLAEISCASFFPSKPLGCYGDGGMIFTNKPNIADRVYSLAHHGKFGTDKYNSVEVGLNSRLDTIQAAILIEKFKIFETEKIKRQQAADLYRFRLRNLDYIKFNLYGYSKISAYAQFCVLCDTNATRTKIVENFKRQGIPFAIYYPITLPEMLPYKSPICPVAYDISRRILALPFGPYITEAEIETVCKAIKG